MAQNPPLENAGQVKEANSIRPAPRREKATAEAAAPPSVEIPATPKASNAATLKGRSAIVPGEVRARFVQVKNKFYFPDGARAFTDRGNRLTTSSENTEVIRSLISIAQARGWNEVTVRGTERFRKEAWAAGTQAGIEVRGYKPSEFEQGHVVRTLSRRREGAAEPTAVEVPKEGGHEARPSAASTGPAVSRSTFAPEARSGLLTGKLLDHGSARYKEDPRADMSYFVKVETSRGDRTVWGIDLERAVKESLTRPQIGDEIGLRAVRQEKVTVKTTERDESGRVIGEKELDTHRNRWILEKREFFNARAVAARTLRDLSIDPKQGAKRHPELVGTYLQVHAAELAARRIPHPQDRERFVAQVRTALADSVARGEPLPPVRLKEHTAEATRSPRGKDRHAHVPPIVRG